MIILNESKQVVKSEIMKYIKNKDHKGLTQYLASMPDDTICPDPIDPKTVYHKASNGVKSGWSENKNGKRTNIRLWKDDEVAKWLIGDKHTSRYNKFSEGNENEDSLNEDTVQNSDGTWSNVGKEGSHGKFKNKKKADAQRKAMFANGYSG